MTTQASERKKLRTLLASASDGELTPDQGKELNALLEDRHDLVREYTSLVCVDHLLRQEAVRSYMGALLEGGGAATLPTSSTKPLKKLEPRTGAVSQETRSDQDWNQLLSMFSPRVLAWSGVTAALLLVGAMFWTLLVPPTATIIEAQDAIWADAESRRNGAALGNDWRTLESGTAKIAFRQGATMTVEGPATFRVLTSTSCELQAGSLSALVPEEAVGFSVVLGNATIVDLGTAFRIDRHPDGRALVYVTQGMVRIDPAGAAETLTLKAGQVAELSKSEKPQLRTADSLAPRTSDNMVFDTYQPASLGIGQYKHDDKIYVFMERPETVLQHEVRMDLMSSGLHTEFTSSEGTIPAGTRVRSYLIHFSPQRKRQVVSGSVHFPTQILGVLCDSDRLNATNSTLGSTVHLFCLHPERGVESRPDFNSDIVSISADRRKLSVKFRTESIDQVRVITAVEP